MSDLAPAALGLAEAATCKTPRFLVNREIVSQEFALPNSAAQKAAHDKYVAIAKH